MGKKRNNKKFGSGFGSFFNVSLPEGAKKWIFGIIVFILAIIVALSFLDSAGVAGKWIVKGLNFLIGEAVVAVPVVLVLAGITLFRAKYEKPLAPTMLSIFVVLAGVSGAWESFGSQGMEGGWIGFLLSFPFMKLFGALVSKIVFIGVTLIGLLIFWYLLREPESKVVEKDGKKVAFVESPDAEKSLIKKIFTPSFKVKEVEERPKEVQVKKGEDPELDFKTKQVPSRAMSSSYKLPPLDLLEQEKGRPSAGDTITNSTIIKKTLDNFGVGAEMSEVNIGPTVTQYTLKPAEGVKLTKITTLSNNLSLALASHPIRIEAPIPGKSLVGIELPNKERCKVRLREMLGSQNFQKADSSLMIALGKDVSGNSCYADLSRMPHLLAAGATGTGKTIFLNNLILSLLYQNSPEFLRLIMIDPKRVEFSAYQNLPHLLAPVIFDSAKAVNALRWLVSEMERRFEVLSQNGSRNIQSYNAKVAKTGDDALPFIVLIVDELADLMASRGRDVEGAIVRLAQMARAVGIHLVLATQRPSVEVLTGLIKANITARVTFQVASQVDSRTVLDMAGAEKLLGMGDMLYISAESNKPRRIQAAYVSEKEVKKVVDFVKEQGEQLDTEKDEENTLESSLAQDLEKNPEAPAMDFEGQEGGDDPLYEDAKKIVVESRKASASLLQRRLRVGYARAARLLDILEEKGIIGPGEGAKPREILAAGDTSGLEEFFPETDPQDEEDWEKV